jgi:chemotaxis protein methyltransferase CheR
VAQHDGNSTFIKDRVRRLCGVEFAENKANLIATRLRQRPIKLGFEDLHAYIHWLRNAPANEEEWQIIINCLTTHTTEWFREFDHFRHLRDLILPNWLAHERNRPFRIWSAACSYGEEPYSLALMLYQIQQSMPLKPIQFEIYGSDIDTSVLEKAKRGLYPVEDLKRIPTEFQHGALALGSGESEGWLKVRSHIRDRVKFEQVNLLELPYAGSSNFDLILCRNVFIYFKFETIGKICRALHEVTNPGGYLYIGHSESLSQTSTPWKYVRPSIYIKDESA